MPSVPGSHSTEPRPLALADASAPSRSLFGAARGGALAWLSGDADKAAIDGLFQEEMSRATQRRGGESGVEARQAETSQRRAERRMSFGRRRAPEREAERDPHGDRASLTLERAIEHDAPRPAPATASSSGAPGEERAVRAHEPGPGSRGLAPSTPGESERAAGPPAAAAAPPSASAGASPSLSKVGAALGAAAGVDAARVTAPERPQLSTPVGATSPGGAARTRSVTATPPAAPTPDPEMVERAAEVLRQIRIGLTGRAGGAQEVTLSLAPVELGRLAIRMQVREGRVSTVVRAESAQTVELLERQAPELKGLLERQGFESDELVFELMPDGEDGGALGSDADRSSGFESGAGGSPLAGAERLTDGLISAPELRHALARTITEDSIDTYA